MKKTMYAVVRSEFHGGGIVSEHDTEAKALHARHQYRGSCECGCASVIEVPPGHHLELTEPDPMHSNPYAINCKVVPDEDEEVKDRYCEMTPGEMWEGLIGEQSPREFMGFSPDQTPEEAIREYLDPANFPFAGEVTLTDDEIETLTTGLTKYIEQETSPTDEL